MKWKRKSDLGFKTRANSLMNMCKSHGPPRLWNKSRSKGSSQRFHSCVWRYKCLPGGGGPGTGFQLEAKDTPTLYTQAEHNYCQPSAWVYNVIGSCVPVGGRTKMLTVLSWELSLGTHCSVNGMTGPWYHWFLYISNNQLESMILC